MTDWTSEGQGAIAAPVRADASTGGERILATSWDGPTRLLSAAGDELWASDQKGLSSAARPLLLSGESDANGVVIAVMVEGESFPPFGADGLILMLDADSGEEVGSIPLAGFSGSDPMVYDLDADGDQELIVKPVKVDKFGQSVGELQAFDVASGEVERSVAIDGFSVSTPLIADLDGDGRAELVDASGSVVTCFELNTPVQEGSIERSYQRAKGPGAE